METTQAAVKPTISSQLDSFLEQEENLLSVSLMKTMQALKDDPTNPVHGRTIIQTKKALTELKKKSSNKVFDSLVLALEYLNSHGWKVSQGKLYTDRVLFQRQSDGKYKQQDLDEYAQKYLQKIDLRDDVTEGSFSEKLKYEVEVQRQKAELLKRKNQVEKGMYVLKSDTEHMLASRATFLKNSLENFIHSVAGRLIETVGGDNNKIPDLIDVWCKELDILLDSYSKPLQFNTANMPEVEDGET